MRWIFLLIMIVVTGCTPIPIDKYLYDDIVIEIQPASNIEVDDSILDDLKEKLDYYLICREDRIGIVLKPVADTTLRIWTHNTAVEFKYRNRTILEKDVNDRHLKVFISILPGVYVDGNNSGAAGIAFSDTYIAIFNLKYFVILHELGHIIGLVDLKIRGEDPLIPERPRHCNNKDCVMFWQVNSGAEFDSDCRKDINYLIRKARLKWY